MLLKASGFKQIPVYKTKKKPPHYITSYFTVLILLAVYIGMRTRPTFDQVLTANIFLMSSFSTKSMKEINSKRFKKKAESNFSFTAQYVWSNDWELN